MLDFEAASFLTGQQLLELTSIIRATARNKPDDERAQGRAEAAVRFFHRVDEFPDLDEEDEQEFEPSTRDNTNTQDGNRLPPELLRLIVNHVMDFHFEARQRTLVALSCSSTTLRALAEPHLYSHPRDLDTIERQWRFLFTLAVEPYLASLVQSLRVLWLPSGENSELLVDIARACPNNNHLLIQRGQNFNDVGLILVDDVISMADLLEASPSLTSFWYTTFTEWRSADERHGNPTEEARVERRLEDDRFAIAAQRLEKLTLHGQAQWLLRALSPHLAGNLKLLTLGQDMDIDSSPDIFSNLSRLSPALEELEVRAKIPSPRDLVRACKIWGATLQDLRVWSVEEVTDWISEIMPFMKALKVLILGMGCYTSIKDLRAIADSPQPQRFTSITLNDLEVPSEAAGVPPDSPDAYDAETNEILVRLIDAHCTTLEVLDVNRPSLVVGQKVLQSLGQARRLECLHVGLHSEVPISKFDKLLDACPNLNDVEQRLVWASERGKEWAERTSAADREAQEELRRNPNGLGT